MIPVYGVSLRFVYGGSAAGNDHGAAVSAHDRRLDARSILQVPQDIEFAVVYHRFI